MRKNKNTKLLNPTTLYTEAERRYQELLQLKEEKENKLLNTSPGDIHIVSSERRTQFYLRERSTERSGKYIRKSDSETIRSYLQKSYDEKILKLVSAELGALEQLLKKQEDTIRLIQCAYSDYPPQARQYIDPVDVSDADFVAEWLSKPYTGKEIPDHIPVYQTERGERVRSKSELTIANMLAEKGIPYKYECPLTLSNGTAIYPDFTVLNVKERKEIYWEHRGMMDDRDYAKQAVFKIKSMAKSGIVIGKDLIITEETSANPLGTDEIDMVIKEWFS